ncbi:MAG TPA: M48 family metallopeptidase [Candidatus Anaerotruncus excrementipullorum]|uniref:M48 family metallopeptidase n=1 Tax=Candidatus Anaerotruncus excrementipullorum TaxID=2838465 RepID=A0A9D2B722_9FIRM|nr:M48 family metallopeptidase [Candidatus Anaerotruncus excrementipullorum]
MGKGAWRQAEGIDYRLTRKPVKNLNLRVSAQGEVAVSAPRWVPLQEVDRFVASRRAWILAARERMELRAQQEAQARAEDYSDEECLRLFGRISDEIWPQFQGQIPRQPQLRVRWMKSRWGVCHPGKGYITLNKRLMGQPLAAVEYVVLHEYVHFLEPNHQAGFHREMARRMPDYRERRKLLR